MKSQNLFIIGLIIISLAAAGCAKEVDPKKPIAKVTQEAKLMSLEKLQKKAQAYVAAINAQRQQVGRITDQMKGMSVVDIFSDKAKPLKKRLAEIQRTTTALLERYQIYAAQLQERGGDVSQLQIN